MIAFEFENLRHIRQDLELTTILGVEASVGAEFSIVEEGRRTYEEFELPVCELALQLAAWVARNDDTLFLYESIDADEPVLEFRPEPGGWRIHAHLAGIATALHDREEIRTTSARFVAEVSQQVRSRFGIDMSVFRR